MGDLWGTMLYNANVGQIKQMVGESERQTMIQAPSTPPQPQKIQPLLMDNTTTWEKQGTIAIPKLGILLPIYNQPYNAQALAQGAQQLPTQSGSSGYLW